MVLVKRTEQDTFLSANHYLHKAFLFVFLANILINLKLSKANVAMDDLYICKEREKPPKLGKSCEYKKMLFACLKTFSCIEKILSKLSIKRLSRRFVSSKKPV